MTACDSEGMITVCDSEGTVTACDSERVITSEGVITELLTFHGLAAYPSDVYFPAGIGCCESGRCDDWPSRPE